MPEKSFARISATCSMSRWKSVTKTGPLRMMLPIDLEISDLPPPDTVHGLWHSTPSARDATRRHAVPSICFSRRIFVPHGRT